MGEGCDSVNVFLLPAGETKQDYDSAGGSRFVLSIAPCCGDSACVETAWKQAKMASIGRIEEGPFQTPPAAWGLARRPRKYSPAERAFLDSDPAQLGPTFIAWAARKGTDPHGIRDLLAAFLVESCGLSQEVAEGLALEPFSIFVTDRLGKKASQLYHEVKRLIEARDMEVAEKLVAECVQWARQHGLKAILHSDVRVFCREKGVHLESVAERVLFETAKLKARARAG